MQNIKSFATLLLAISALFLNTSANAATTVKSAINPGDVGPIVTVPFGAFSTYVNSCKTELGFDTIPQFDCRDELFRPSGDFPFSRSNDFVAHRSLNSAVDAVFACRWVVSNTGDSKAASGEMIVHNKDSGKTCFFRLKETNKTIPDPLVGLASNEPIVATTNPPSPTDSNATDFWDSVFGVAENGCTRCHSAGPYIASPQIVGALAQFGLINDGHDTSASTYQAVGAVVAAPFNQYIHTTLQPKTSLLYACSSACHVIGGNPEQNSDAAISDEIVIPSINLVINDELTGHMPPSDPYSDYRWVNLDKPGGAGGDWERLKDLKVKFPQFVCKSGVTEVQAHVVDSVRRMSTADFPDVLHTFNLLDGLVCRNADQADGHTCGDYQTRYHCPSGRWTPWRNTSTPDGTGEIESRDNFPSLCSNPTEIQARTIVAGSWQYGIGPPDRLQEFDLNGVACRNASQPSGQCNDYTVRFICAQ